MIRLTHPIPPPPGTLSFDNVILAVELVKQRLDRAVAALKKAQIPYAIAGSNAVALCVSTIDPAAARTTVDVEYQILTLEALVQTNFSVFHDKDRTHLRDMIEVALLNAS